MSVVLVPGDGGVLLSGEECAYLAASAPLVRAGWRQNGHAVPVALQRTLEAVDAAARLWRESLATSAPTSAPLPQLPPSGSETPPSRWISTQEAADLVGVTARAVRDAAESGRILGQKRGDGAGTWLISEASAEEYARTRKRSAA